MWNESDTLMHVDQENLSKYSNTFLFRLRSAFENFIFFFWKENIDVIIIAFDDLLDEEA